MLSARMSLRVGRRFSTVRKVLRGSFCVVVVGRSGCQPVPGSGWGARMVIRPAHRSVRVRRLAEGNCWRHLVTRGRWRFRSSWMSWGSRAVAVRAAVRVRAAGVVAAVRVDRLRQRIVSWTVAVKEIWRAGTWRAGWAGRGRAGGVAGGAAGFGADEVGRGQPGPELLADHRRGG